MLDYSTAQGANHPSPRGNVASTGAISLAKVAPMLDVSLSTVKALCRSGQLKSIRIGRRRLISYAELARFITAREAEASDNE